MGFYPVNPAEGIYILGKPMVEKAEISIGDKPFKVKTVGWSDENIYVQSVKLNGRAYNKLFITHADIVNGGTLEFTMSSVPGNFKHAENPENSIISLYILLVLWLPIFFAKRKPDRKTR